MRHRNFVPWLVFTLCFISLLFSMAEARKRRHHQRVRREAHGQHHRTPIYGGLFFLELPPAHPQRVIELLQKVGTREEQALAADFHQNPCTLFEGNITIIEPHRIVCRNSIYLLDETTPQFWWFETDRKTGKVERQTLVDVPREGDVLTQHTLDGTSEERGLYLATSEQ